MARGDIVAARLTRLIDASAVSITVHYPAPRPAPVGLGPSAPLISPLSGVRKPAALVPSGPAPAPVAPPLTMPCLWTDTTTLSSADPRDNARIIALGWVQDAHAMLRVLARDAALDPTRPTAGTVFDACEWIERNGQFFRVLQVRPISAAFTEPTSFAVWVVGAVHQ